MGDRLYLACLDHDPPLISRDESEQHLSSVGNVQKDIQRREFLVELVNNDGHIPQMGGHTPDTSFMWHHQKCRLGIWGAGMWFSVHSDGERVEIEDPLSDYLPKEDDVKAYTDNLSASELLQAAQILQQYTLVDDIHKRVLHQLQELLGDDRGTDVFNSTLTPTRRELFRHVAEAAWATDAHTPQEAEGQARAGLLKRIRTVNPAHPMLQEVEEASVAAADADPLLTVGVNGAGHTTVTGPDGEAVYTSPAGAWHHTGEVFGKLVDSEGLEISNDEWWVGRDQSAADTERPWLESRTDENGREVHRSRRIVSHIYEDDDVLDGGTVDPEWVKRVARDKSDTPTPDSDPDLFNKLIDRLFEDKNIARLNDRLNDHQRRMKRL